MHIRKIAALRWRGRGEIARRVVDLARTPKVLAAAFGGCGRSVRKRVRRFQADGYEGLQV